MIEKIISGGQIGADQAALKAAVILNIPTGGWAPKGFQTSHGKNPFLGIRFHLQEVPLSGAAGYIERSKRNVNDADGTVAFKGPLPSSGTDKTIGYCKTGFWQVVPEETPSQYKPILVLSCDPALKEAEEKAFSEFLIQHQIKVLNICGQRENGMDWEHRVKNFIVHCLLQKEKTLPSEGSVQSEGSVDQ